MISYELFTQYDTLFNSIDTAMKCFSRCTYIKIAISVITRTGYNEQVRLDLGARCIRFLLYSFCLIPPPFGEELYSKFRASSSL